MDPHYHHVDFLGAADIFRKSIDYQSRWCDIKEQIDWCVQNMVDHLFVDFLTGGVSHARYQETPCEYGY